MNQQFNKLSPAEAERLFLLLEEMGEVQQIIGKVLRHGYESCHPDDLGGDTNRQTLERELGDVAAAVYMMAKAQDLDDAFINFYRKQKLVKVKQYLHHQEEAHGT